MRALVRELSPSFTRALVREAADAPPSLERGRAQHAAYVAALEARVESLTVLAGDPAFPDCCFVEDQAVVSRGIALITRSGAPSRRGEADPIAAALAPYLELRRMQAPATLDGGDVLEVGGHLFVGCSERTNAAGIATLRSVFEPVGLRVVPVEVPDALHLKCFVSSPAPDVVLLAEGVVDPAVFRPAGRVVLVPAEESYAANTVALGAEVLVAAGYPRTLELVSELGLQPVVLDMSEIARADGALTCQSILY